jgi:hypothetical protein
VAVFDIRQRFSTRTVEHDLPREIDYLRRHDEAIRRIMDTVEMPNRIAVDLVMFVRRNNGPCPKNGAMANSRTCAAMKWPFSNASFARHSRGFRIKDRRVNKFTIGALRGPQAPWRMR